ncbi:hypothetical protein, partial [Enterocloster lavalensis]|uniref:hypothetical protein n=1 Tax=Enterocloster lavalensis TaxID=460384 RepID=UPI0023F43B23
ISSIIHCRQPQAVDKRCVSLIIPEAPHVHECAWASQRRAPAFSTEKETQSRQKSHFLSSLRHKPDHSGQQKQSICAARPRIPSPFHPPIKRVTFPVILCYNEGNVSLIDSLRLPTMYNEGNVPLIDSLRLPTMYNRQHGMNRPPNGW